MGREISTVTADDALLTIIPQYCSILESERCFFFYNHTVTACVLSPVKVQANGAISGKRKHQEVEDLAEQCRLTELEARVLSRPREGAVFWPQFWRSRLCTCTKCKVLFSQLSQVVDHKSPTPDSVTCHSIYPFPSGVGCLLRCGGALPAG